MNKISDHNRCKSLKQPKLTGFIKNQSKKTEAVCNEVRTIDSNTLNLSTFNVTVDTVAEDAEVVSNDFADISPCGLLKNMEPQLLPVVYEYPVTDKRKFNKKWVNDYVWLEYSLSKDFYVSQLHNTSPELSQRLFGLVKPSFSQPSIISANEMSSTSSTFLKALVSQQNCQARAESQSENERECSNDVQDATTHIPTVLGLKIRSLHKQQQQELQEQCTNNSNSLLKQQLRSDLKVIVDTSCNNSIRIQKTSLESASDLACSALQSLANVAERQVPVATQQPLGSCELQQQLMLHMAANPMIKPSNDFFHRQQQQQQTILEQQQNQQDVCERDEEIELLIGNNNKLETDLMIADEKIGLQYKSPESTYGSDSVKPATDQNYDPATITVSSDSKSSKPSRSVQRRRVRRKAQSCMDDQAEHLTEMSVRGLDLFRYACITEGVYQCTECAKENVQKTFKNKYSFQRHAFLYHEGKHRKVFPCPLCGKEFSRPDKMKNHMKMTHENYVSSKEIASFNPLNYLITAAAAGEMHATLFTQQQSQSNQQQQHKHQLDQIELSEQEKQYKSALAALSVSLEAHQNRLENANHNENATKEHESASGMDISAAALLKLEDDIGIKNELVISPMSSPPETKINLNSSPEAVSFRQQTTNAKAITQRLEEVK